MSQYGPRACKIPLASATRLSQRDPWLSPPASGADGPPTDYGGQASHDCSWFGFIGSVGFIRSLPNTKASSMPEKDLLINLSIIKEVIWKVAFGRRQKLPFFAIEEQESQLESRYGSKRYSHPFLDGSEESFVLTRQKTSFSVSDTLRLREEFLLILVS